MAAENEMCHKLPPPIIPLLSHMSPNLFPHRQGKEIKKICAGVIRRKKNLSDDWNSGKCGVQRGPKWSSFTSHKIQAHSSSHLLNSTVLRQLVSMCLIIFIVQLNKELTEKSRLVVLEEFSAVLSQMWILGSDSRDHLNSTEDAEVSKRALPKPGF